jgi:release factor glutamine methyltransferase
MEFADWIRRRSQGVPLAYLRQWQEFYGRRFFVDERVLIPRPETELLVEEALRLAPDFPPDMRIADVGTGSGCVAITLALELPRAQLFATDISPDALMVVQRNANAFGVHDRICFLTGDLLIPLQQKVDWILANLPYIAQERWQQESSLACEPRVALVGEGDGTGTICRLLRQALPWLNHPGRMLVEIGEDQGGLAEKAKSFLPGAEVDLLLDLAGLPRLLRIVV